MEIQLIRGNTHNAYWVGDEPAWDIIIEDICVLKSVTAAEIRRSIPNCSQIITVGDVDRYKQWFLENKRDDIAELVKKSKW